MKLLDKLKNAIFEEVEEEQQETMEIPVKREEKIVKKIDIEKTIQESPKQEIELPKKIEEKRESHVKKPIIFDDEDFLSETREVSLSRKETSKVKEKPLYGGFNLKDEKAKERFKPSPIISPVYGLVQDEKKSEFKGTNQVTLDTLLKEEKKKPEVTFDTIREKAFGKEPEKKEVEKSLLYEMKQEETVPGIEKVTLGDAEEYFNDLGLEYEVDYKDAAKANITRETKNKELSEIVEEEIKGDKAIQEELENKKTTKKSSKLSKMDEAKSISDVSEPEEKNLYDLIDMMYDSKEWYKWQDIMKCY